MGVCFAKSSISRSPRVVCRRTLAVGFGSRLYVALIVATGVCIRLRVNTDRELSRGVVDSAALDRPYDRKLYLIRHSLRNVSVTTSQATATFTLRAKNHQGYSHIENAAEHAHSLDIAHHYLPYNPCSLPPSCLWTISLFLSERARCCPTLMRVCVAHPIWKSLTNDVLQPLSMLGAHLEHQQMSVSYAFPPPKVLH
jgi:hypothetical protein